MKAYYEMDMPWRPTYEYRSALAWSIAFSLAFWHGANSGMPYQPIFLASVLAFTMGSYRWCQTVQNWEQKIRLVARRVPWIKAKKLGRMLRKHPDHVFLGYGFEWQPKHAQRAYDLITRKMEVGGVPSWYKWLRRIKPIPEEFDKGDPYIHGVEREEKPIRVPISHLDAHTLVLATTGGGKTRLFEILVYAAVMRNEPVAIIDPKHDKGLKKAARRACEIANRPEAFFEFHPGFPTYSCRFDPLFNWSRPEEVASRLAVLIATETANDPFQAIGWRAMAVIAGGMVEIGERPNIKSLRHYVEGGPESLLRRVIPRYMDRVVPGWKTQFDKYLTNARKNTYSRPDKGTPDDVVALVQMYKEMVDDAQPDLNGEKPPRSTNISGLLSIYSHSREHVQKLLASLYPVLDMLTAGDLESLLSPDPTDPDDERPILDSQKIVDENLVFYMALDSLSDSVTGTSVGSLVIADLTSTAGARYNYGKTEGRVNIFMDEGSQIMNDSAITMLNASRGAGYSITIASQTVPDFIARTGSESKARQVLGNVNNLIALRCLDAVTQEYIVESFGPTTIKKLSHQIKGMNSGSIIGAYTGGYGETQEDADGDLFSAQLVGKLPDLQYVAHVSGNRIIKGRLPLIDWS